VGAGATWCAAGRISGDVINVGFVKKLGLLAEIKKSNPL
jgi:hypothetical protein